jgi:hypothetical protein
VPAPAPVSPERDTATLLAQLKELGQLRDAGVLSEAEFEVQKAASCTADSSRTFSTDGAFFSAVLRPARFPCDHSP